MTTKDSKTKKFIYNPLFLVILGSILSFIGTLISDSLKGNPVFTTFLNIILWLWHTIITILTFSIPVYVIILVIFCAIVVLYIRTKFSNTSSDPFFLQYTSDTPRKLKWSWRWKQNHNYQWYVDDLRVYCPTCDTEMIKSYSHISGSTYFCPRCQYKLESYHDRNFEYEDEIAALISDNANRIEKNRASNQTNN